MLDANASIAGKRRDDELGQRVRVALQHAVGIVRAAVSPKVHDLAATPDRLNLGVVAPSPAPDGRTAEHVRRVLELGLADSRAATDQRRYHQGESAERRGRTEPAESAESDEATVYAHSTMIEERSAEGSGNANLFLGSVSLA